MKIDIEKARRGAEQVHVDGFCSTTARRAVIEEAMAAIIASPDTALKDGYLGVKNYAGFGDQRHDGQYGYGPRHGHIVFRVGRREERKPIDDPESAIYYLECERDFAPFDTGETIDHGLGRETRKLNLCGSLRWIEKQTERLMLATAHMDAQQVDAHEPVTA